MKCHSSGDNCQEEAVGEAYWHNFNEPRWVAYCEKHLDCCKEIGLKIRRFKN